MHIKQGTARDDELILKLIIVYHRDQSVGGRD